LTERQKRLRVEAKERAKIKELRELALKPPPRGTHRSAYQMFVQERGAGRKGQQVGALAKEWSQEWKSVTPAQQEVRLSHDQTTILSMLTLSPSTTTTSPTKQPQQPKLS
jgi:hypothetical protein